MFGRWTRFSGDLNENIDTVARGIYFLAIYGSEYRLWTIL